MIKLNLVAGTALALTLGTTSFVPAFADHAPGHVNDISQADVNMGGTEAMVVAGIVTDIYNDVVTIKTADGKEAKLKISSIEQKRLGIEKGSPISAVVTEGDNDVWVTQKVEVLDDPSQISTVTTGTTTSRTTVTTTETTTQPAATTTTTQPAATTTTTTTTEMKVCWKPFQGYARVTGERSGQAG
jgi:hypothetical protein